MTEKQTTQAERNQAEMTLWRMMREMGMTYLTVSMCEGDSIGLAWGNDDDSVEGCEGVTLDQAYVSARFEIEGMGQTQPPF